MNISFFDDLFHEIVNPERDGERQRSSISENSFSADRQKKKKKTAAGMGDDIFEVLGSSSTRSLSLRNNPTKSTLHSGSSFQALTECISCILGNDDLIQNLEITPVSTMREIPELDENVKEPFADSKSSKKDTHFTSSISTKTFEEANTQTWDPTTVFMEEIDLHLELQNYLKEFENYSASKARTKNTLHNNKVRYGNSGDIQIQGEKFFEGKDEALKTIKHSQQFLSKDYCHLDDDHASTSPNDELDEDHIESRIQCSQTQLAKILNQIRRGSSERPSTAFSLEKTRSTKESIDGYEKIFPFDFEGKKSSNNVLYQNYWRDAADICESYYKIPESKTKKSSASKKKKLLNSEKTRFVLNLQDLILIYKSILEEHQKIQRSSIKPVKNALFSYLNSLISKRFKEKQNEAVLVNFSKKSFTSRHSLDGWKSLKKKDEVIYLKEFVTAFQNILESSMPIREILRLNNAMSNLESYPDGYKKYLSPKNSETGRPKSKKKKRTPQQEFSSELKISSSAENSPERTPVRSSSTPRSKRQSKVASKEKKEAKPSSRDLQLKLESFLNAVGEDYSGLSNLRGKMLVNVKVAENQILVNDLSFLNNESSLPIKKSDTDGSSDLIIETMPKVPNKESRIKKNNERTDFRLLPISPILSEMEEVKKEKTKSKKRKEVLREVKKKSENSKRQPLKSSSRFEFDGMRFKAQHPIDSIAEESEYGFINKHLKGASEKKNANSGAEFLEDNPDDSDFLEKLAVVDDLMTSIDEKDAFGKTLSRTKSSVIKPPIAVENFNLNENPPQIAKSLFDLKTRTKNSKKTFWPQKNFFCYSSITQQENPLALNKKPKQKKNVRVSSPKTNKIKKVENQKVFQEVSSDTNLETSTSKPSLKAQESETNTVQLQNSILYLKNEKTDCCSIELLFTENNVSVEKPIVTTEVKSQTKSLSEEPKMKTNVSNSVDFISSSSASVIFHPCNSTTDDRSYSLALIHSDSFLKCFSQASLVQRDIKTFFKSSSDVKFHPENENEGKKDVKPFITFVLTSDQFEKADLSDDVLVIKKTRILNKEKPDEGEEETPEIRLQSIENFIKDISKTHAKKMSTKPKETEEKKDFTPSLNKRKSKTRCQTCQFLSWKEKERRKKGILKKMNGFGLKGTVKSNDKTRTKTSVTSDLAIKQDGDPKTLKIESEEKIKHQEKEKTESKARKTKKEDEIDTEIEKKKKEMNKCSVVSMNLEDTPLELVEAIKKAFIQAEDSRKKKTSHKIEEGVGEKKRKRTKTPIKNAPKKSFIIKIYCEKKEVTEIKEKSLPDEKKKETKDSALLKKVEAENLENAESTYFDALEKNLNDDAGGAGEEMNVKESKQSSENADPEPGENEKLDVKSSSSPSITESEEKLLQEQPEEILNEISKCIIKEQISFLLLMLDSFLNKTENLLSKRGKSKELKNLIRSTDEKTKDLMMGEEKSSWLKVFMVLDELSKFLANENVNNFIKTHLNSTKNFVRKILQFNISKMGDSQNLDSLKIDDKEDFFVPITRNSKLLKDEVEVEKIFLKEEPKENIKNVAFPAIIQQQPVEEEPKEEMKTANFSEIIQPFEGKTWEPLKTIIEEEEDLKKQNSNDSVLMEIRDMKNKVVEELKLLEKMFLVSDWNQLLSSSEGTNNFSKKGKKDNSKFSEDGEASKENNLNPNSRYLHFLQCLMKVWDTRMSLNIYPNDCFN